MKRALMMAAVAAMMVGPASADSTGDTYNWLYTDVLKDGAVNVAAGVMPTYSGTWYQVPPWHDWNTTISHNSKNPWMLGTYDDSTQGVGYPWAMTEDSYLQIDLGSLYNLHSLTALFYYDNQTFIAMYAATSFRIQWSATGEEGTFEDVKNATWTSHASGRSTQYDWAGPTHPYNWSGLTYDFDLTGEARFIRIDQVTTSLHWMFSDFVVLGTAVPEPAAMSLLVLGGLALLRRRKR